MGANWVRFFDAGSLHSVSNCLPSIHIFSTAPCLSLALYSFQPGFVPSSHPPINFSQRGPLQRPAILSNWLDSRFRATELTVVRYFLASLKSLHYLVFRVKGKFMKGGNKTSVTSSAPTGACSSQLASNPRLTSWSMFRRPSRASGWRVWDPYLADSGRAPHLQFIWRSWPVCR